MQSTSARRHPIDGGEGAPPAGSRPATVRPRRLAGLAERLLPFAVHPAAPGLAAVLFSVAMLGGALAFQYIGGLRPCDLCMQQRWAHAAALLLGGLTLALRHGDGRRAASALAAGALLAGAGIAAYHVGVEQGWWASRCAAPPLRGASIEAMLAALPPLPAVRCDEVQWTMLGLSMAAWNGILSVGTAVVILGSLLAGRNPAAARRWLLARLG